MPVPLTGVTGPCFHAGMGRHQAADGAAAHPLVEAALRRRAHASGGAHHERAQLPGTEGPIGWPGPEREEGEGIGWPGDLPGSPDSEHTEPDAQPDEAPAA
jgi:hypothetical protein